MAETMLIRCKNIIKELEHSLKGYGAEITPQNPMAFEKGESREVIIKNSGRTVCEIIVGERTYKIITPILAWKEKTNYRGISDEKAFSYNVDSMDECTAEVERLFVFSKENDKEKNSERFVEWPKDAEGRLRYMNSIAAEILKESIYESERNETETEKCVNIYPKGAGHTTRNRVAAIWALRNAAIHFLVKREIYEGINSRVVACGIKAAKQKKSEYVYESISVEQAKKILEILAGQ